AAQSDGGNLGYAMADAVKVIDGAIAAFGAEPVLYAAEETLAYAKMGELHLKCLSQPMGYAVIPLYTTPPAQVVPENCVTAEHRRVIEMLLNVCGAAFELADDSCQQDVDGEECHVVPDDAFQKLSDALDEIENTLPTEDVDRTDVFLAWSAMPRAALKSILQADNSPATPDGWQLVPKEPTEAMNKAGWAAINEHDAINPTYRAMLAAAPQHGVKSAIEHGMQRYAGDMQKLSEGDD
ncbi:TPA: hypothetical protein ACF6GQ_003569, partial [Citrobacter freundii]